MIFFGADSRAVLSIFLTSHQTKVRKASIATSASTINTPAAASKFISKKGTDSLCSHCLGMPPTKQGKRAGKRARQNRGLQQHPEDQSGASARGCVALRGSAGQLFDTTSGLWLARLARLLREARPSLRAGCWLLVRGLK